MYFIAPKSIVTTCVCSAILGAAYLFALLFAIPDVASLIQNNGNDNNTLSLIAATFQASTSYAGALGLTILLLINIYVTGVSSLTASSRIW